MPAGAPEGQPKRKIEEGSPLYTLVDVHDDDDGQFGKFEFQTNSVIEGFNTFFYLTSTLTPATLTPEGCPIEPDVYAHQQHVYSVRRTKLTKLLELDEESEGDGYDGYLIDGGERGAKCHFILEKDFRYFLFEKEGRSYLNSVLSEVFDDQTVYIWYISMPLIQKREPFHWPDDANEIRNRMIVKPLNTVGDDFSEIHAGIILRNGKKGVVNWIRRI